MVNLAEAEAEGPGAGTSTEIKTVRTGPPQDYPSSSLVSTIQQSVPSALREIAAQIPDQAAVITGSDQITYSDLVARAAQVGNAILDRATDPEVPVALLCGHGIDPVLVMCGVLHAGRIGTNIDAREPHERMARLLEASGATLLVTDRALLEIAESLFDRRHILLTDETLAQPSEAPTFEIDPTTPSFVLFTSGSTGTPKGVVGAHADIVPRAARSRSKENVTESDRTSLTTSFGFTAAEGRVFGSLLNGATLCTYDIRTKGPRGLATWIQESGITVCQFVPSTIRAIADSDPGIVMESVRRIAFGGEALFWRDVQRARKLFSPEVKLKCSLGSTEAGGIASYAIPPDIDTEDGVVPVGTLDPGVEVTLVDDDGEPVADGKAGRIVVVRDDGRLAIGYWKDPALTAEYFFTTPDGRRGFRTPDQARWRPDGLLEHVQRIDSRVKVHGAMVATSEVERELILLPEVADAAVLAAPGADDALRLVAYVVANPGMSLSAWKLRRDLARRLPSTSVPSAYVALDVLPRTVRAKVDRKALPPAPPPVTPPYRAPTLAKQRELCELFAEILGVERVGLDDDFFDLGGDSLGVVELVAAISERFGIDVPASMILDAPTVALITPLLAHRRVANASIIVPLGDRAGSGSVPERQSGSVPFFCVTGGGAPAISLRALADATGDVPFYGIQPRGLEERALPDHSIEAAARRAVKAMRGVRSTGPYAVGGYSFGGLVAFEAACRIAETGEKVGLLVILDTVAPGQGHTRSDRLRSRADALRSETTQSGIRRSAVVTARATKFAVSSAAAHAERRIALTSAGLLPRRGLAQYDLFLRLNSRMAREYRPAKTFDGSALVVRIEADGHPRRADHDLGWSRWVRGPITVVEVNGDHLGLLRSPAVNEVGRHLRAALEAVD